MDSPGHTAHELPAFISDPLKPVDKTPKQVTMLDPQTWSGLYGNSLYRYACARLRDPQLAEDAVQETYLSAIQSSDKYQGRCSENTWLMAIVKHKIADRQRVQCRERSVADESEWDSLEDLFDASGRWRIPPIDWDDPKIAIERADFWRVFSTCLRQLPKRLSEAIMMRDFEGATTGKTCKVLDVSKTNLWVMLHRARAKLRRCLELRWFGSEQNS